MARQQKKRSPKKIGKSSSKNGSGKKTTLKTKKAISKPSEERAARAARRSLVKESDAAKDSKKPRLGASSDIEATSFDPDHLLAASASVMDIMDVSRSAPENISEESVKDVANIFEASGSRLLPDEDVALKESSLVTTEMAIDLDKLLETASSQPPPEGLAASVLGILIGSTPLPALEWLGDDEADQGLVGFSDLNLPIDHNAELPADASTNLEHLLGPSPGVGNFLEASGNGLLPDEVALKEDFVATPGMACLGTMEEAFLEALEEDWPMEEDFGAETLTVEEDVEETVTIEDPLAAPGVLPSFSLHIRPSLQDNLDLAPTLVAPGNSSSSKDGSTDLKNLVEPSAGVANILEASGSRASPPLVAPEDSSSSRPRRAFISPFHLWLEEEGLPAARSEAMDKAVGEEKEESAMVGMAWKKWKRMSLEEKAIWRQRAVEWRAVARSNQK